jgi:hypothetical protein
VKTTRPEGIFKNTRFAEVIVFSEGSISSLKPPRQEQPERD